MASLTDAARKLRSDGAREGSLQKRQPLISSFDQGVKVCPVHSYSSPSKLSTLRRSGAGRFSTAAVHGDTDVTCPVHSYASPSKLSTLSRKGVGRFSTVGEYKDEGHMGCPTHAYASPSKICTLKRHGAGRFSEASRASLVSVGPCHTPLFAAEQLAAVTPHIYAATFGSAPRNLQPPKTAGPALHSYAPMEPASKIVSGPASFSKAKRFPVRGTSVGSRTRCSEEGAAHAYLSPTKTSTFRKASRMGVGTMGTAKRFTEVSAYDSPATTTAAMKESRASQHQTEGTPKGPARRATSQGMADPKLTAKRTLLPLGAKLGAMATLEPRKGVGLPQPLYLEGSGAPRPPNEMGGCLQMMLAQSPRRPKLPALVDTQVVNSTLEASTPNARPVTVRVEVDATALGERHTTVTFDPTA